MVEQLLYLIITKIEIKYIKHLKLINVVNFVFIL
jgi:hypothetical protein